MSATTISLIVLVALFAGAWIFFQIWNKRNDDRDRTGDAPKT